MEVSWQTTLHRFGWFETDKEDSIVRPFGMLAEKITHSG